MNKKIVFIISLLMTLILIANVLAITASIGNARMILRAETGDKIEKYILVKNVNDVAVNIALTASGDLQDSIIIKDNNFTLAAGEEKKAYFTIEVKKQGTTETRINVQFTPLEGKNGAGLSSTIIVITNGTDTLDNDNVDVATDNADENNNSSKGLTGNVISEIKIGKTGIVLLTTSITFIAFIVLLVVYYTKSNKKRSEIAKIKLKKKVKISA